LLDNCDWEWAYSFENKKAIFDIHRSYKFTASIFEKGNTTTELKCKFMVHDLQEWAKNEPDNVVVERNQIDKFSPYTQALMEVENQSDIDLLEKIYTDCTLIKETNIEYSTEYHMSGDADKFRRRNKFEDEGYEMRLDGTWEGPNGEVALPFVNGALMNQFEFPYKEHESGNTWEKTPLEKRIIYPKYLALKDKYSKYLSNGDSVKVCYRGISRSTDTRTFISSLIPNYPCSDNIPVLRFDSGLKNKLLFLAFANSYTLDFVLRHKLGNPKVARFVLEELPIPTNISEDLENEIVKKVLCLNWNPRYFPDLEHQEIPTDKVEFSVKTESRAQLREDLDKLVMQAYGLSEDDLKWILRPTNDDPRNLWKDYQERLKELEGLGNWGELPQSNQGDQS
jgi:hypothetical protein